MQTAKVKTYTPEQLANADHLFKMLSVLPEDKQRTVAMVANAFLGGMMAQERLTARNQAAQPPAPAEPVRPSA